MTVNPPTTRQTPRSQNYRDALLLLQKASKQAKHMNLSKALHKLENIQRLTEAAQCFSRCVETIVQLANSVFPQPPTAMNQLIMQYSDDLSIFFK